MASIISLCVSVYIKLIIYSKTKASGNSGVNVIIFILYSNKTKPTQVLIK